MVFCLNERAADVDKVLRGLKLEANIVSFDEGDYGDFDAFMDKYGEDVKVEDFQ